MKEPAVRLCFSGNFHYTPIVPIRRAEELSSFNAVDDFLQDFSIPATRLAFASYAINHMPAPAVSFPRHLCLLADFGDFQVGRPLRLSRGKIMRLAHFVRSRSKDRRERRGGM